VDLHTTELRKQGVRIRLPLQSFQVLEALLLQPGELVTRKELKEKLWPADSFGDFEHGLNAAVNRVRDALGDSSDNPRFVETLPRRGYRFLAPVNGVPRSTAAGVLEDGEAVKRVASPTSELLDSIAVLPFENAGGEPEMVVGDGAVNPYEGSVSTSTKTSADPGKRPRRVAGVVAGTVLIAGLGIATIAWLRQTRKPNLPEPRLITSFGFGPTLSRDGKLLAYCSDVGRGVLHILLQQTAGGEAIPVVTGSSVICDPDLSPDGTRIAFDQVDGIYLTSTFRGEPRLLVGKKHAGYPGFPRFSPCRR
jgi:DNA-binding winged helix-turn-helix (wHTH) protein